MSNLKSTDKKNNNAVFTIVRIKIFLSISEVPEYIYSLILDFLLLHTYILKK